MSKKIILCRCEDVTLTDVENAVASGCREVEEVKRYTGFGTGPCQGKECLRAVALAIADAGARAEGAAPSPSPSSASASASASAAERIAALKPFTTRPPLVPTELGFFAGPKAARAAGNADDAHAGADTDAHPDTAVAPIAPARVAAVGARDAETLPAADIAIIGAGVMGLALAYNLALHNGKRIVVLDANHLAWGASGRNGGGIRQQWSTEMNIRLMQESMAICAGFAQEMGINVWMRRGGYLFLARTEAARARMEKNITLQNQCDVPTRLIEMDEVRALVPPIDTAPGGVPFAAACYNPTDGIVFPWPFLWGYARAATRRGVTIRTSTPVTAIERRAGGGFRLETPAGAMAAERVVNATGAWSPELARMLDVPLPDWPERHEILSTEALKPFLKPMVSVLESGLYFSQSLRGEIVGGISLPGPRDSEVRLGSRLAFLEAMSRALIDVMPCLAGVKVVRQWAGPYDLSPDGDPIVGQAPGVPGFYVCCGFVGHGFMMAPVVARHLALHLLGKGTHPLFDAWRPDRFATRPPGGGEREEMNIG